MPAAEPPTDRDDRKRSLRQQARENRLRQENKDELSRVICGKFLALPEYVRARTVLFYVDARSEVRTRECLVTALAHGKTIVIPWCNDSGELELFRLERMEDLATGTYGILEPRQELRSMAERQIAAEQLDLIAVPGLAFTRNGGRLGHGKGYFDRLLARVRADAHLVGLAFECQLFPEIPIEPHDVFMHRVLTESAIYGG